MHNSWEEDGTVVYIRNKEGAYLTKSGVFGWGDSEVRQYKSVSSCYRQMKLFPDALKERLVKERAKVCVDHWSISARPLVFD